MKLNPDCVRDVLLVAEEKSDAIHAVIFGKGLHPQLAGYSREEEIYHVKQCAKAGLVDGFDLYRDGSVCVRDVSPLGHRFLAETRENKIWSGVKSIAEKIGTASLDGLVQIASNVTTQLIKAHFGLQ